MRLVPVDDQLDIVGEVIQKGLADLDIHVGCGTLRSFESQNAGFEEVDCLRILYFENAHYGILYSFFFYLLWAL
jgi:hypothetical protein